nr:aspyridones efflux protein apdf [Quercus suber]
MIGFAWAQRVIGFIALATLAVSNGVMRVRVLPAGRRKIIDPTAFKDGPFMLFSVGMAVIFLGLYCPFFYLQSYVLSTGIMSERMAFYLLSIMNSTSVFGRIFPNLVADKTGPFNMIIPCATMAGVLTLILIGTHSSAGVIVIACFYGFFSGSLVSLPPTIYVSITKNRALIGTRMGMGFAIASIGVLTGTPISGAVLNASSFTYVWVFGGLTTLGGMGLVLASRVTLAGSNPLTRA